MLASQIHLFVLSYKPLLGKCVTIILARPKSVQLHVRKLNQSFPIESLAESRRVASPLIFLRGNIAKKTMF